MRRERLTQHNTQLTCLFQPLSRAGNNVNPNSGFRLDPTAVLVYLQAAPDAPDMARSNSVAKE
jgi:hypothetical protein